VINKFIQLQAREVELKVVQMVVFRWFCNLNLAEELICFDSFTEEDF
jgi:hypothetical protein